MAYKRQQISITDEDFDLIPYFKSKANTSKFILDCIREHKDREEYKKNEINEERIIEIIESYLKIKKSESATPKMDKEVLNSLTNILKM